MRHLLNDRTVRKRLVLSTSDGRYVVASAVRHWNPVSEYFKNHANSVLLTVRSTYKGVDLGSEVRYALELKYENGTEEIVPLQIDDYRLAMFRTFQLTQESLQSKEALESFLKSQIDSGNLTCKEFHVLDLSNIRVTRHEFYRDRVTDAKRITQFEYWVFGRLGTYIADRRLRASQLKPAQSRNPTPNRDTDGS